MNQRRKKTRNEAGCANETTHCLQMHQKIMPTRRIILIQKEHIVVQPVSATTNSCQCVARREMMH